MLLSRLTAIILLASTIAAPRPAPASIVIPGDISQLAKEAKVIFAGTVASMRSEWNAGRTTIVTRVLFKHVTVVKGNPVQTRTELMISGGKVGDEQIITEGQPQFVEGGRYVLLCNSADLGSERNRYLPIIGLNQGFFPIRQDRRSGRAVVVDSGDREIAAIQRGKLVVVGRSADGEEISGSRPSAVDIPFTPGRGRARGRDSLGTRPTIPPRQPNTAGMALPRSPNRPDRNETVPPADWVPGSQQVVLGGEPTVRVLDPGSDPGTRMSESQFLNEIRRLMAP